MIEPRRGTFSAALSLFFLTLGLIAPRMASGQTTTRDRPRVVLLALTADDPLAGRLVAELESLGLSVVRAPIDPTVEIEDSVRKALTGGARAVVVADGRRTEFWIAEEGSDRVALRQELEIENSPALESVLSLRTVEFLRVSLGLVSAAGSPAGPAPGGAGRARENRPDLDRRFSLGLSSGLLASTGRLPPFVIVGVELRARITGPLAIEVRGYAPIGNQNVSVDRGDVRASVWLAGLGFVLAPRTALRLSGEVGAGMMTAIVRSVGTENIAYEGRVAYLFGVAPYARGAARLRLSAGWSLRLDVIAGTTTIRRPVIAVAPLDVTGEPQDVTAWGEVFGAGLAGLEVYF